jgi:20S proteasome alpha/beta subunit
MTLIVGFKCGDSAVLCADSQETRGDLKTEVNKLQIVHGDVGCMDLVCGGAGQAELSDAFLARLGPAMKHSKTCGEEQIRKELEGIAAAFHQSAVFRSFPGTPKEKIIAGLIAVRDASGQVFLFKFFGPTVRVVATYELAGEEYEFFALIARRRYRDGLTIKQALLLGVEIISEARQSSIYVGGPTRVVNVMPAGIVAEDPQRVAWTDAEITRQNELIDILKFELSSSQAQVESNLKNFSNSITSVKAYYGVKLPPWPAFTLPEPSEDEK